MISDVLEQVTLYRRGSPNRISRYGNPVVSSPYRLELPLYPPPLLPGEIGCLEIAHHLGYLVKILLRHTRQHVLGGLSLQDPQYVAPASHHIISSQIIGVPDPMQSA